MVPRTREVLQHGPQVRREPQQIGEHTRRGDLTAGARTLYNQGILTVSTRAKQHDVVGEVDACERMVGWVTAEPDARDSVACDAADEAQHVPFRICVPSSRLHLVIVPMKRSKKLG